MPWLTQPNIIIHLQEQLQLGLAQYVTIEKNNYTTAIGFNSLYALKGNDTAAGNYITAVGAYAGYTEQYGYDHTLIGYKAGYNLTASTGSIVIGYDAASGPILYE